MIYATMSLLHVCAATIGMISGSLSMVLRKGSGLHRAAGTIFVISMLAMAPAGLYMALFIKPNRGNVLGAVLTFYVVATGWVAGRRREHKTGKFDLVALSLVTALAVGAARLGVQTVKSPHGIMDGYPAGMYFTFATMALLFAASDVRMIVRGGIAGAQRIGRHVWRMGFALTGAFGSFYPGQARLFSRAIQQTNLLYVPFVLALGMTLFWLARVSRAKRAKQTVATPSTDTWSAAA